MGDEPQAGSVAVATEALSPNMTINQVMSRVEQMTFEVTHLDGDTRWWARPNQYCGAQSATCPKLTYKSGNSWYIVPYQVHVEQIDAIKKFANFISNKSLSRTNAFCTIHGCYPAVVTGAVTP